MVRISRLLQRGLRGVLLACGLLAWALPAGAAAEPAPIRLAVLADGTVAWEADTIRHYGLDAANGVRLEVVELVNPTATKIALQAGRVDAIVADWVWVSRQRRQGADLTFAPYSRAVGALIARQGSDLEDVSDLAGRRIGIVGGPLDKNWLLLRAYAIAAGHGDPEGRTETLYGAPPLMSEQLRAGRVDAVLTYWHYAARLVADGHRKVIGVPEIVAGLDVGAEVPMLGYVFDAGWAQANRDAVRGFLDASRAAKRVLDGDPAAWARLRPRIQPEDDAELAALRDGFRAGIPRAWGEEERDAARRLWTILSDLGGAELVGPGDAVAPGTFWHGDRF